MSISAAPGMRRRSRRQNVLQQHELEATTSLRLTARSEHHDFAKMRMRPEDVQALRSQASTLCSPIIALFSSGNPREPVNLRSAETLYVRLPADKEAAVTELPLRSETDAEQADLAQTADQTDTAQQKEAQTHTAQTDAAEIDKEKVDKKELYRAAARRRVTSAWTPLRLVAHHSYVAGMRVSGIVHRAVVRLEFDKP